MRANPVVGANRGLCVGHADVDVLATDRGPKDALQRVLDQRIARRLIDVGFPRRRGRMHADAHELGARPEHLPTDLAKRRNRLGGVGRDLRPALHHRLEQLAANVAFVGIGLAKDVRTSIQQLVVLADQQQFLLDAECEWRLGAELRLPETVHLGRSVTAHLPTVLDGANSGRF